MISSPALQRYAAIVDANIRFERAMIDLTAMVGGTVDDVTDAFKR